MKGAPRSWSSSPGCTCLEITKFFGRLRRFGWHDGFVTPVVALQQVSNCLNIDDRGAPDLQTGQLWQKQGEHELAEGCFATAMVHAATLAEACASTALPDARRQQLVDALATLYTARAQAAWALQQEVQLHLAE